MATSNNRVKRLEVAGVMNSGELLYSARPGCHRERNRAGPSRQLARAGAGMGVFEPTALGIIEPQVEKGSKQGKPQERRIFL